MRPTPYVASLRIYEPLSAFEAADRLRWDAIDFSDINKTMDSNHYVMTYNWNVYCPDKLDNRFLEYDKCLEMRNNNED